MSPEPHLSYAYFFLENITKKNESIENEEELK